MVTANSMRRTGWTNDNQKNSKECVKNYEQNVLCMPTVMLTTC